MTIPLPQQGEAGTVFVLDREAPAVSALEGLDAAGVSARLANVTHFVLECVPDEEDVSVLVGALGGVRDVTITSIAVGALSLLQGLPGYHHPIRDILKSLNPHRVCVTYPSFRAVHHLARQRHVTRRKLQRRGLIPTSDDENDEDDEEEDHDNADADVRVDTEVHDDDDNQAEEAEADGDEDGDENGDYESDSDNSEDDASPFDDQSYDNRRVWLPMLVNATFGDPLEAGSLGWDEVDEVCLHDVPMRVVQFPPFKARVMRVFGNNKICAEHGRLRYPERVADLDEHDDVECMASRADQWLLGLPMALDNFSLMNQGPESLEIVNVGGNLVLDCHCRSSFAINMGLLRRSVYNRTKFHIGLLLEKGITTKFVAASEATSCFCGRGTRINASDDPADDRDKGDDESCTNNHVWSMMNPEHFTGDGTVDKAGSYEIERQIANLVWLEEGEGIDLDSDDGDEEEDENDDEGEAQLNEAFRNL